MAEHLLGARADVGNVKRRGVRLPDEGLVEVVHEGAVALLRRLREDLPLPGFGPRSLRVLAPRFGGLLQRVEERLAIERDGELVDDGAHEAELQLVQRVQALDLERAEDGVPLDHQRQHHEALRDHLRRRLLRKTGGAGEDSHDGGRSISIAIAIAIEIEIEIAPGGARRSDDVHVAPARVLLGREQPIGAEVFGAPLHHPHPRGVLQEQDRCGERDLLGDEKEDVRERPPRVREAGEQLADRVEVLQAPVSELQGRVAALPRAGARRHRLARGVRFFLGSPFSALGGERRGGGAAPASRRAVPMRMPPSPKA